MEAEIMALLHYCQPGTLALCPAYSRCSVNIFSRNGSIRKGGREEGRKSKWKGRKVKYKYKEVTFLYWVCANLFNFPFHLIT